MAVRRLAVVGLAALAGCYDPAVQVGLPCGPGCPSGQECQGGFCFPPGTHPDGDPIEIDASTSRPDAAPVDGDGDGVLDDDDNCKDDANPDQHDEDGDDLGDVCDLCPHVAEIQVQDADGDQVGDLCDPETGVPNRIVFFDPFTSDRPEWSLPGGWVRAGDTLSIVADIEQATLDLPRAESVFELGGSITAAGSSLNRQIAVSISNEGTLSYYCEIFDGGTPRFNLTEDDNGTYTAIDTVLLPDPLPVARFRFIAGGSPLDGFAFCEADYDDDLYVASETAPIAPHEDTHIYVQNLSLVLDYAIQIDEVLPP